MEGEFDRGGFLAAPIQEQTPNKNLNTDNIVNPSSSPSIDYYYEFDESRCLFCNQTSPNLDQNLVHMLKAHGLYVDLVNLRAKVDVESLLAYFHLVISGRYECLYCGTQRNTHQAVQQHMMAKGHCKYDITDDEDAELRDFYQSSSSSDAREELLHRDLHAMRSSYDAGLPPRTRRRNDPRPSKRSSHRDGRDITDPSLDQALPTPTPQTHAHSNADSSSNDAAETLSPSLGELRLSTRALKQECTLNNQLARLRADDRRSLLHLPASQQRALLATHHKQMEDARRTEQTKRTNLESAGNKFNCLGKIRLIRKPPHTGNVHSLNR
jgi:pre-60S factor REI1